MSDHDSRLDVWFRELERQAARQPPPTHKNPPKRHHYVPVMYLERFGKRSSSKATARVCAIDLRAEVPTGRVLGVRDVAAEVDLYRAETEDPAHAYEGEHLMGVFERAAGPAFRALDRRKRHMLDDVDRFHLSLFMALQFVRGPNSIQFLERAFTQVSAMAARVYASNEDALRSLVVSMGEDPTEGKLAEAREVLGRIDENMRVIPDRGTVVANMFKSAEEFTRFFFLRRWLVLRSRTPFITSDCPIALWQNPTTRETGIGLGVATADMILFAVDRYCALAMQHPAPGNREGVVDISRSHTLALNKALAAGAQRWIFHHPDDAPFASAPLHRCQPRSPGG